MRHEPKKKSNNQRNSPCRIQTLVEASSSAGSTNMSMYARIFYLQVTKIAPQPSYALHSLLCWKNLMINNDRSTKFSKLVSRPFDFQNTFNSESNLSFNTSVKVQICNWEKWLPAVTDISWNSNSRFKIGYEVLHAQLNTQSAQNH